MTRHDQDRERRRAALDAFFVAHRDQLESIYRWAKSSGVGYNTLNEFIKQLKPINMRSDTYEKLAKGAADLIGRPVMVSELLPPEPAGARSAQIARIVALLEQLPPAEQELWLDTISRHSQRLRGRDPDA